MSWKNRMVTEAELNAQDNGEVGEFLTLKKMSTRELTCRAVEEARNRFSKEKFEDIYYRNEKPTEEERKAINKVWRTLPGYTCFDDALAIVARK